MVDDQLRRLHTPTFVNLQVSGGITSSFFPIALYFEGPKLPWGVQAFGFAHRHYGGHFCSLILRDRRSVVPIEVTKNKVLNVDD